MLWLSIFVTAIIGGIVSSIFLYLTTHKVMKQSTAQWLVGVVVVCSVILMHLYGTPYFLAWNFENKIKKEDTLFQTLSQTSPVEFNNYISEVKNSIMDNNGKSVSYYTGEYIYSQLKKYSTYASNQEFYALAQATVKFYSQIFPRYPNLVVDLEFNLPATGHELAQDNLSIVYTSALNSIMLDKKDIILSAIRQPQQPLSESDKLRAQTIIQDVLLNLYNDYGNDAVTAIFNHPGSPDLNQAISAEIIIKFYKMLLDHGENDGGMTIRYLFSMANNKR